MRLAADASFFGHPRGLATLFFTEMWERFSYYGMRAILILFMTAPAARGGLAFGVAQAGLIYGLYTSLVYLMSVPGGWIADRLLGQRKAVLWGGILIVLGQFSLVIPALPSFYAGLALLVLGTGLLKPNISTMVGQLYGREDHRRDAGFSIFYMGINMGALLAPLAVGYVGQRVNWNLGFLLAGVGMTAGLIQYWLGGKYLWSGLQPATGASAPALRKACVVVAPIVVVLIGAAAILPITLKAVADTFGVVLIAVTIAVFGWLLLSKQWTSEERRRLLAAAVLFLAAALFFSAYEQAGSTLTLLADRSTDNRLLGLPFPSSWFQALPALYVIALAPLFAWLWMGLGRREPSSPAKFAFGLMLVGLGFAVVSIGALRAASGVRISPLWLAATYLLHVLGEMCLSPVGLSAMTKLAPAKVASLMMGVWFLAGSIGDYIGGRFGALYETYSPASLFAVVAAATMALGFVLLLLARPIRRLMGGVN